MTTISKRESNRGIVAPEPFSETLPLGQKRNLSDAELAQATKAGDDLMRKHPGLGFERIRPRREVQEVEHGYVTIRGVLFAVLAAPLAAGVAVAPTYFTQPLLPAALEIESWGLSVLALSALSVIPALVGLIIVLVATISIAVGTSYINLISSQRSPLAGMARKDKAKAGRKVTAGEMVLTQVDLSGGGIQVRAIQDDSEFIISYDPVDESEEWRQVFDQHLSTTVGPKASLQQAVARTQNTPRIYSTEPKPNMLSRASTWFATSKKTDSYK